MVKALVRLCSSLAIFALMLSSMPAAAAHASTLWTVESVADGSAVPGDCPGGGCTLRDAIAAASSGDTINFSVTGVITLNTGELTISSKNLTITGPGSAQLTISGGGVGRIFDIVGSVVTISGLTLTNGAANTLIYLSNFAGGAILNESSSNLTLNSMLIENNSVDCAASCPLTDQDGMGGAIFSGSGTALAVSNSSFINNTANLGGGAIAFNSGTAGTDTLSLFVVTFSGNQGTSSGSLGGALLIVMASSTFITVATFSNNSASAGGALWIFSTFSGTVEISAVTFDSNQAKTGDGGAVDFGGTQLRVGGSTFSHNTSAGLGGGLDLSNGTATVFNSTFAGNSANFGGGIGTGGTSTLVLDNDTISGNTAVSIDGAGLLTGFISGSAASVSNTIMAGNLGSDCASAITWSANVDNLIQSNSGTSPCPAPAFTADPMLAPPALYGGTTQTMALIAGSPAIDHGNLAVCADVSTVHNLDQRGRPRPVDGDHNGSALCDIGAYERQHTYDPADMNGAGTTDIGVFRPSTGGWFVKTVLATSFGISGDDPLPFDFNGDGTDDVAVYRPSTSAWYVKNQFSTIFGLPGDVPVPGDYDGNGTTDVAVYRPSTSSWYVKNQFAAIFGLPGDIPVPGDYNGDGITDIAVFRPSTGAWYIRGQYSAIFGMPGDIPIPGDYNGDSITDLAVYRPSTHAWFVKSQFSTTYGTTGDIPVPGDYNGDGTTDIAVYRPSTSGWFVKNQFSTIYGLTGDYPLPAPDTNADGNPYQ